MHHSRSSRSRPAAVALAALLALAGTSLAQPPEGEVVAEGLNSPMGVLVDPDGVVWAVDSGTGGDDVREMFTPQTGGVSEVRIGESARVVRVAEDGSLETVATLPSIVVGQEATGGARLALLDGRLFATSGFWVEFGGPEAPELMGTVVEVGEDGATLVSDLWAFENAENPDGFIRESHPYDLAVGPDGMLWVADAGANTILRVSPDGGAPELVATLPGIPSPMPNPGRGDAQESDPVPTGVAVGADGSVYVATLPGFPFLPGSAGVWRVAEDGTVESFATDLSMITDLTAGPDGALYAVSLTQWTEQGPTPGTGQLVRIGDDGGTEVVLDGLMFPSAVAFDEGGNAYLTMNTLAPPGAGQIVRFGGIAAP